MLKPIIIASLVALASPACAEWQLPAGNTWQTQSGLCRPGDGDVDGCAYGPEGTKTKTAVAYFRVCGDAFESRPFLIVDLANRNFVFDLGDGSPPQIKPLARGIPAYTHEDVAKYFYIVQSLRGPCAKELAI